MKNMQNKIKHNRDAQQQTSKLKTYTTYSFSNIFFLNAATVSSSATTLMVSVMKTAPITRITAKQIPTIPISYCEGKNSKENGTQLI